MTDLQIESDWPGTVKVLLNRPGRRNALTLESVSQLFSVLQRDDTSIMVLGSTTPDIFCAGADLGVPDGERAQLSDLLYACYDAMVTRPGPIIAVVEGPAVGGGAQLTTAADLRIATPSACWRWVGPRHGLAVGSWILPELLGRSRGLDLCMSSRWLRSGEALATGFVTHVDTEPWGRARALADVLSNADCSALGRIKRIATRPEILRGLREERNLNRQSWNGKAPSPSESAAEGRSMGRPSTQ